jgi:hypothetical protein
MWEVYAVLNMKLATVNEHQKSSRPRLATESVAMKSSVFCTLIHASSGSSAKWWLDLRRFTQLGNVLQQSFATDIAVYTPAASFASANHCARREKAVANAQVNYLFLFLFL